MRSRGQALVELAISLPLFLVLAFGGVQFARLALARAGLDAATAGAAAAASRSPSATSADAAGRAAFASIAAAYRLDPSSAVTVAAGDFSRGGVVTVTSTSSFDPGFSAVPALAFRLQLRSIAGARVEDWRSRPAGQ